MKNSRKHLVQWAVFWLSAIALFFFLTDNKISWKEEVQLQSGEVIVVQRTAKTKPFGEIGGSGGWENEGMTLRITKPERAGNPPLWDAKFVPMVFDRHPATGEWFIVATFYSCTSWYELGRPNLPYTEFRLKGGKWAQLQLSADLIGREANMLTRISSAGEPDRTLDSKASDKTDPRIDATFKRVLSTWTTSC